MIIFTDTVRKFFDDEGAALEHLKTIKNEPLKSTMFLASLAVLERKLNQGFEKVTEPEKKYIALCKLVEGEMSSFKKGTYYLEMKIAAYIKQKGTV